MTSLLSLLSLLLLTTGPCYLTAHWLPLCSKSGSELFLDAEIVGNISDLLVVNNTERDVKVKCHNRQGTARIYDSEDRLLASHSEAGNVNNTVSLTLWQKNVVKFWKSEKTVKCNDHCEVKLVEVKDGTFFKTNCRLQSVEDQNDLMCNITDWIDNATKAKKPDFECNEEGYDFGIPVYEFSIWSESEVRWKICKGEFDHEKNIAENDKNITLIKCGVTEKHPREPLLVKMTKRHKDSKSVALPFLNTPDNCQESTYFIVNQHLEDQSSKPNTKVTILIAVVVILGLFLVFALVFIYKRRGRPAGVRKTEKEIDGITGVYIDHSSTLIEGGRDRRSGESGDSTIEDLESYVPNKCVMTPGLERQCSVTLEAGKRAQRMNLTDKEKNEMLQRTVLDGNSTRFNPNLPLMAQPRHLHYDRRYERSRDSFHIGYMLGQGQYGAVFVGTAANIYGPEKTKVAVKQAKELRDQNQFYTIIDELKIMSNLKMHPNLVNLLGACTSESHLNEVYLIMEYCPFGDLKRFLLENREKFEACLQNQPGHLESPFNSSLLYTWGYSIARGLDYLSSLQIMHGDLAARNILLGENYVAKISDFGLSKMMYYNEDYKKTQRNMIPWAWMATEYLQTGEFNIKSDVWSYGVTLWEIFTLGNKPYGFEPYEEIKQKILAGERLPCPEQCEHLAGGRTVYDDVMRPCWASTASHRPSFSSLASSLEALLGEEGVTDYRDMYTSYMKRLPLLQRQTEEREETPLPPYPGEGYVQFEAADGLNRDSYIKMESGGQCDAGYSRHVATPGGYIALVDVNK